jgi:hypothetical protein
MSAPTAGQGSSVLKDIQAPVKHHLERVPAEMVEIMSEDLPLIQEVAAHLLRMRG